MQLRKIQAYPEIFADLWYMDKTGGPRYSQIQYSRFRLFAVEALYPKLSIRNFYMSCFAYLKFF